MAAERSYQFKDGAYTLTVRKQSDGRVELRVSDPVCGGGRVQLPPEELKALVLSLGYEL